MAGYSSDTDLTTTRGGTARSGTNGTATKVLERIKPIKHSTTDNTLILDLSDTTTEGSVKEATQGKLVIKNTGRVGAFAILAYKYYTAGATLDSADQYHLQYFLKPNDEIVLPQSEGVISDADIEPLVGTEQTQVSSNSFNSGNLYIASGAVLGAHVATTSVTTITVDDTDYFKVGDLIQLGINETTATRIEVMEIIDITSTTSIEVVRGLHGTTAGQQSAQTGGHASGNTIYLPIFNIYGGDYNRYSSMQTDAGGRFWLKSFFGKGRAATGLSGITAGSAFFRFARQGYQELTDDGDITAATHSGLTASATYYLKIGIDGATAEEISFTTDASDLTFGNIATKIQSAIDDLFHNPDKNNYEKSAIVSIVDGDLRITSGSHLESSAIEIAAGTSGVAEVANLFDGQTDGTGDLGRFKAVLPAAIAGRYPPEYIYLPIELSQSQGGGFMGAKYHNEENLMYDTGNGTVEGEGLGIINYATGEIKLHGCPPNAHFKLYGQYAGAFSGTGSPDATGRANMLVKVYGNTPSKSLDAELTLTRS